MKFDCFKNYEKNNIFTNLIVLEIMKEQYMHKYKYVRGCEIKQYIGTNLTVL